MILTSAHSPVTRCPLARAFATPGWPARPDEEAARRRTAAPSVGIGRAAQAWHTVRVGGSCRVCGRKEPAASPPAFPSVPPSAALLRWRRTALVLGIAVGVVLLVLAGWLGLRGRPHTSRIRPAPAPETVASAGAVPSPVSEA